MNRSHSFVFLKKAAFIPRFAWQRASADMIFRRKDETAQRAIRLSTSLSYRFLIVKRLSRHKRWVSARMQAERALRNMLCKQYLTTFDKVKITGISLIKSVNNNYWLLPQDRIRQCWRATGAVLWILHWNGRWYFIARFARFRENQCVKLRGLGLAPIMPFLNYAERVKKSL